MGLTVSQLRKAAWREAKRLSTTQGEFVVYVAAGIEGITLSHDITVNSGGGKSTKIGYTVRSSGRRFASPSEAVKHFNAVERQRLGQQHPVGSAQSLKARKPAPVGA